ncbi:unnamed protein product [Linum trigynum]|uniref:Cytochrome P450 n=1 Tax=Linum trigynum TaxID=586398 RepID=A0AAV2DVZ7_9ROSI
MSRAVSSSYCIYPTRPQVEDSPQGSVLDPQHFCSLDPKRHDSIRNYLSNWGKFRSTSLATFPLLHKWLQTIVLRGITESRRVLSGMLIRRCQLIRNRLELEIGKTLHSVRPSDSKQPPVVMFDVDKRYVEAFGIQERGQLHEWVNMALC